MIVELKIPVPAKLSGIKLQRFDFRGTDLKHRNMSNSVFEQCNFDDADMTEANCEGSTFVGSSFVSTICYRTNFRDARLGATRFEPKDAYGMVVSLQCSTFINMSTSQLWFYCWLMFATQMLPADGVFAKNLRDQLVGFIGAERYVHLTKMFERRSF